MAAWVKDKDETWKATGLVMRKELRDPCGDGNVLSLDC